MTEQSRRRLVVSPSPESRGLSLQDGGKGIRSPIGRWNLRRRGSTVTTGLKFAWLPSNFATSSSGTGWAWGWKVEDGEWDTKHRGRGARVWWHRGQAKEASKWGVNEKWRHGDDMTEGSIGWWEEDDGGGGKRRQKRTENYGKEEERKKPLWINYRIVAKKNNSNNLIVGLKNFFIAKFKKRCLLTWCIQS